MDGFICQSLFTSTAQTELPLTLEQYQAQQALVIQALAAKAGIDPRRIRIISVTPK
jgi:hypothetical protein